ncbi:MAG TPA: transcriptional regulator NanR [Bosea sp. (in: a-proteobacteria)]
MTPEPIPRRKLHQEVLDRLVARIHAGEFAPGEQLPSERELMEAYGVGRPSIREALQQLERSGLVSISHGERARVLLPTAQAMVGQMTDAARYLLSVEPRTLDDLKEARVLLEAGVARLAAERVDAAGLALLRARLEEHRQASLDDFLARDIAFHRQIAVMSGNPVFPAVIEGMLAWLGTYYHSLVRAHGAETLTLQEHQRIYDAIAAGKPDEAAQAMSDHLNRANALYRRLSEGEAQAG